MALSTFIISFLLLLALTLTILWANIEAVMAGSAADADGPLKALQCPPIITAADQATVNLTVQNKQDRSSNFTVYTTISEGFSTFSSQYTERFSLDAGETQTLRWPISGENAVYDQIVIARVHQLRSGTQPSGSSVCGIYFLDTNSLTGQQLLVGTLGLGLLGLVFGSGLWWQSQRPFYGRKKMLTQFFAMLTPLLLLNLLITLLGYWLLSIVLFVAMALVIAAAFDQLTRTESRPVN